MKSLRLLSSLVLATALASCAVEKSENPLTPTIAGPIPGVEITAPKPLEPGVNWQIPGDKQPITLLLENSNSNGPRPLTYVFEVASDAGFSNRVFAQDSVQPGPNGRTSITLPNSIPMGRVYYWRGKAGDGANEGPYSQGVSFNLFTPLAFDKPTPQAPVNNEKVSTVRPTFRFGNAPYVGTPVSVNYVIEVATSDSFANKLAAWQFGEGGGGTTSFTAAQDLAGGLQLFWRVRAFDGGTLGPWSDTHVFRTPTPVAPTPTPGPAPGGSCASKPSHLGVVECRRAQYNHMSSDQVNQFLRLVASDLNAGNFSGGPFGIWRKTTGSNCLGYSCDIVCSGSGTWDVLGDSDGAQTPLWSYIGGPDTSKCEIQK